MKWTPRDTAHQLQRLTRHTSFVTVAKYAFVGLAGALVLMVFLVPVLHDDDTGARLVFTSMETGDTGKPRMNNPRFQGVDKNGRPYNINARMAEQQEDERILLTNIEADMTLQNGSWLAFNGKTGMFDTEANTLKLPENVEIFHDAGYDMRTTNVFLDLDTANAIGEAHVEGQGPLGTIKAEGFRVDSAAGRIIFSPSVTVTLYPGSNSR